MASASSGELVIETSGLRKEFTGRRGTRVAVSDLDLAVPRGGVHGFLGPNGSGKTTTIRCLLGLVRPSAGTMSVLGRPSPGDLRTTMPSIGAIVETPALFPTMTGRENLELLGAMNGIGPRRVEQSLESVSGEIGTQAFDAPVKATSVSGEITITGNGGKSDVSTENVSGGSTVTGVRGNYAGEVVSGEIRATVAAGSVMASTPFCRQLPRKICPKDGAIRQRMPIPASAHTAISRELPVPKNSPQTRIAAPR